MLAFINTTFTKKQLIARLEAHYAADEIKQGDYWSDGKGCAVGCCVHGNNHSLFPALFGIPESIAYLMDGIFEGLLLDKAKHFPLAVIRAIPEGSDLSKVKNHFLEWLLIDSSQGVIRFNNHQSIKDVAALHHRVCKGETVTPEEWTAAWTAARDTPWAAACDTARTAAWTAAWAAACDTARDTARAAAWAAACDTARDTARTAARAAQSQKLIELLASAPVLVVASEH